MVNVVLMFNRNELTTARLHLKFLSEATFKARRYSHEIGSEISKLMGPDIESSRTWGQNVV